MLADALAFELLSVRQLVAYHLALNPAPQLAEDEVHCSFGRLHYQHLVVLLFLTCESLLYWRQLLPL